MTTASFKDFVSLIRPLNAAMALIGTYIGYALARGGFGFNTSILFALLSVLCIISAGQSINDYFDVNVDKKNKKSRPIASGKIAPNTALVFSILLFVLGILFASFLNTLTFQIAMFFSALLFLYSAVMQKIKFVGNAVVALGTGFTFIFGASVYTITPLVLMVALSAFFSNWAREVMKDVEDKETDKGHKITLPHILSARAVNAIALGIILITLIAGYLPTFFARVPISYTALVSAANIVFIFSARSLVQKNSSRATSLMKKGMLVGLLAQLSLLLPL